MATANIGIQKDLKKFFCVALVRKCLGHFKKANLLKDRNETDQRI